jgi:hypothetical protein
MVRDSRAQSHLHFAKGLFTLGGRSAAAAQSLRVFLA